MIPGKDISGDGVVLEVPGFVVDILNPKTHSTSEGNQINIRANIVMMCGCPTSDGGLWDSSEYQIKALIHHDGRKVDEVPLEFTGETNLFEAAFTPSKSGEYIVTVYAFHPNTENSGVDKTSITVEK